MDRVGTFLRSRRDEGVEMMPLVLFGIFAWSVGICVDGLPPPVRVLKGGEPIAGQPYAKQEEREPGVYDRGPINLPTEVRKSALQRFDELFFANTAAAWIAQQWILDRPLDDAPTEGKMLDGGREIDRGAEFDPRVLDDV